MDGTLPPTYLPGWHDEEKVFFSSMFHTFENTKAGKTSSLDAQVRRMRYVRLGETDLVVSQAGIGW